jgi:hypothetical protein
VADISTFQGFKADCNKEKVPNDGKAEQDPFWLLMKNYDYLSYD